MFVFIACTLEIRHTYLVAGKIARHCVERGVFKKGADFHIHTDLVADMVVVRFEVVAKKVALL